MRAWSNGRLCCEKDLALAQEWLRRAFEGFRTVTWERPAYLWYRLGKMCAFGYGTEQSYTEAAGWYGKAVAEGNSFAAFSLAGLYQRGQGVAQSDEKAFSLYQMAAEDERHPNAYAMVELGRMCRTETGTGDSGGFFCHIDG